MDAILNTIKPILLLVLSEKCYDTYFLQFDFLDGKKKKTFHYYIIFKPTSFSVPCFKATLSKVLGIGIIAGSLLVKIPQILKIFNAKSGEGISVLSTTLDLCAITIATSYGFVNRFPFSSWGDGAFLAIQTAAIAYLILYYAQQKTKALIYIICYAILCYILMGGLTPVKVLWYLQGGNIPLLLVGKLTQAYANYKNKSTGQLSAVTLIMLFSGSTARIFTSIQETGDNMLIITYIASTFANGVILSQLLYYWDSDKKKVKKSKKMR